MLTYVYSELFTSPARVLVNAVNTTGSMAHGQAATFKRVYPAMYAAYRALCQNDQFSTGQFLLYRTPHKWVLNFPIKKHPRANARLALIEQGLQKFATLCVDQHFDSVSFPMLGAEDGLAWEEVRPLYDTYLKPLPITIYVHLSEQNPLVPDALPLPTLRKWLNSVPQSLPFATFWNNLKRAIRKHDSFATLEPEPRLFQAQLDDKRGSVRVLPQDDSETLLLPRSQWVDFWRYLTTVGYVLPADMPNGLDATAPYMLALVTGLDNVRPLWISRNPYTRMQGLHYLPPLPRHKPRTVTLHEAD